MISISYTLNQKDFLLFSLKKKATNRIIWGLCLIILLINIILNTIQFINNSLSIPFIIQFIIVLVSSLYTTIVVIIPGYFIGIIGYILVFLINKKKLPKKIKYTFDKEKIISETDLSKKEFPWDNIKKISQDKRNYYILFTSLSFPKDKYTFIPKSAFSPEDLTKFESLFKDKKI